MKELKQGNRFNQLGIWYNEIDEVIAIEGNVAFVEGHEDDGFKKWYIFEKVDGLWKSTYNSSSKDAMGIQFAMLTR